MAQQSGIARLAEQKQKADGEGSVADLVFREFGGMDISSPRQSIPETDFYWLENVIPIAAGNLPVVPAATASLATLTGKTVVFSESANMLGVDYVFAFCSDGSAQQVQVNPATYTVTQIAPAGTFTGTVNTIAMDQWKNLGIVIVDSAKGYFDWNITSVGVLTTIDAATKGNSIRSFSGRVWIGNSRTVSFTDVNSYNSLAGAGGSFTISDSTLHNAITALVTANNFLYIVGDDSFDVLGNVAVSGGVTTFTRTNITASIGSSQPASLFPYYRSIAFAASDGFYELGGATPQKVSDKLNSLVSQINFATPISGAQVSIFNILCAAFLFNFNDIFTGAATTRAVLAIFFNNKWFLSSQVAGLISIVSVPIGGLQVLFGWDTNKLYKLFSSSTTAINSRIQTKLWDGGEPLLDKQVLKLGLGVVYGGAGNQMLTVTTDNEMQSNPVVSLGTQPVIIWLNALNQVVQWQNALNQNVNFTISGYVFSVGSAATGGGKYFGTTITSTFNGLTFSEIAMQYKNGKRW